MRFNHKRVFISFRVCFWENPGLLWDNWKACEMEFDWLVSEVGYVKGLSQNLENQMNYWSGMKDELKFSYWTFDSLF